MVVLGKLKPERLSQLSKSAGWAGAKRGAGVSWVIELQPVMAKLVNSIKGAKKV